MLKETMSGMKTWKQFFFFFFFSFCIETMGTQCKVRLNNNWIMVRTAQMWSPVPNFMFKTRSFVNFHCYFSEKFFFYSIEFRVKKSEFRVVKIKYAVIKVEYRVIKSENRAIKSEYRVIKVEYRVIKSEHRVEKSEYRVKKKPVTSYKSRVSSHKNVEKKRFSLTFALSINEVLMKNGENIRLVTFRQQILCQRNHHAEMTGEHTIPYNSTMRDS